MNLSNIVNEHVLSFNIQCKIIKGIMITCDNSNILLPTNGVITTNIIKI